MQPGSAPPPYAVADIDTMWMLANVVEIDSPAFRVGQQVQVGIDAFPDRVFDGTITTIGASVDPNTRRVLVRSEIKDPRHELRSGMFANFTISIGAPVRSPAIPLDGVVREGDGTQTVWVTADRRRFTRRTVKIGDAARRLSADPRWREGRRTGGNRRRNLPRQHGLDSAGEPMKTPGHPRTLTRGEPC